MNEKTKNQPAIGQQGTIDSSRRLGLNSLSDIAEERETTAPYIVMLHR